MDTAISRGTRILLQSTATRRRELLMLSLSKRGEGHVTAPVAEMAFISETKFGD